MKYSTRHNSAVPFNFKYSKIKRLSLISTLIIALINPTVNEDKKCKFLIEPGQGNCSLEVITPTYPTIRTLDVLTFMGFHPGVN